MGTRRRIILKIFLFIIAGLLILRPKDVFSYEPKVPLLILFSYDENNKRTESISQGILSSLQKADVRTEPFIEYLDVQRLPDHTINRSLQELYFMKYFPSHLRVIICEGDHAFRFLVRQGATVFPTVPVVFTGVSDVSILPNSLRKRFTGTVQAAPYKKMVEMMTRLHPALQKIVVIGDTSLTGIQNISQLLNIAKERKDYVEIILLTSFPQQEVSSFLELQEPRNTVILLTSALSTSDGYYLSLPDTIKSIHRSGDFAIYTNVAEAVELDGIIGGAIYAGERLGNIAAEIALDIIKGTPPEKIPFNENEPVQWVFNYHELKKHGILMERLPAGSRVMEDPYKDVRENFRFIITNVAVITVLLALSILLLIKLYRRRQINNALKREQNYLGGLMEGAPEGIIALDEMGRILRANNEFCRMFGYSKHEVKGADLNKIICLSKGQCEDGKSLLKKALSYPIKDISRYRNKSDGTSLAVSISGFPVMFTGKKKEAFLLFRDITRQKAQQNALAQRFHFEALLSAVSSRLVFSGPFENTLKDVLHEIGTRLGLLGCALYTSQKDNPEFNLKSMWQSTDFESIELLKESLSFSTELLQQDLLVNLEPLTIEKGNNADEKIKVTFLPFSAGFNKPGVLLLAQRRSSTPQQLINDASLKILAETIGRAFERKQQQEDLLRTIQQLEQTFHSTISTIGRVIEMKDHSTYGHQNRVAQLCLAIAKKMKLSDSAREAVYNTALVHDLGKLYIPSEILIKPQSLSAIEYNIVKQHSRFGYEVLRNVHFPWPVAEIVLQHHERIDGTGYPKGLKSREILQEAKILAVADVVEAMVSPRPYRPAYSIEEALEEIKKGAGTAFDPSIVTCCVHLFEKNEFTFRID
jgi:PAS domain S-box-containing protein/putative nucleotidyltransferase with HDIG domain